ncbi:response regulator [Tateyamaria pelophila]|uniref:hypothetical protein n=1 Tax=Tateyamaria pelophila TaxID=328415 RepID=UPI001CBC8B17|nr:hypothetical protein [Tateyamaria pelophila]
MLEDDPIIAMDLAGQISDLGLDVCGPHHQACDALAQIERRAPDFAVLDFNLKKGKTSASVAERLSGMGVPFCFLSGYSSTDVLKSAGFEDVPCLSKPISNGELSLVLKSFAE